MITADLFDEYNIDAKENRLIINGSEIFDNLISNKTIINKFNKNKRNNPSMNRRYDLTSIYNNITRRNLEIPMSQLDIDNDGNIVVYDESTIDLINEECEDLYDEIGQSNDYMVIDKNKMTILIDKIEDGLIIAELLIRH